MDSIGIWLSPLLLLPGAALLIMSTSARYGQVHAELHHLIMDGSKVNEAMRTYFLRRAILFRNALVSLYTSIVSFALAGLLGGLTSAWEAFSLKVVIVLTCGGILLLLAGAGCLVLESTVSLNVVRDHIKQLARSAD